MSQNKGDRKGVSNDSPKIPDTRVTSDTPSLPSAVEAALKNKIKKSYKKSSLVLLRTVKHKLP